MMNEQLIIEVLILIAAVYLVFFKSYLTEKGKQADLKTDLYAITHKVESIKIQFTKELRSARNSLVKNYLANRNHKYFKVNPIVEEFSKVVRAYLKN